MTALSSPATTRSSNSAALPALCTAEFRRDWSSFTAAFRVDLPEESQDGPDATPHLILEVVGLESRDTLRFTARSQRAILEHVQGREIVPLREISLAGDEQLSILRLSLTPNRLLVRVGSRLLMNESRPSGLIGARCRFRVAAPPGSVISDLRFDGE